MIGAVKLYEFCCLQYHSKPAESRTSRQFVPMLSAHQIELRRLDEMDPPGIFRVPEYSRRGPDGRHTWNTNTTELWGGTWRQGSNGWRVQLSFFETNSEKAYVWVQVGSTVVNSGPGYLPPPDGRFLKFRLADTNGAAVKERWRAAAKMFQLDYANAKIYGRRPWTHWLDTSLEGEFPLTISGAEYPRFEDGTFVNYFGFTSNGPPCLVGFVEFNDTYSIKAEGDYTLTVRPVLYKMRNGTNETMLDRVDLPTVSATVHLKPR
jgi:hypothetical protein